MYKKLISTLAIALVPMLSLGLTQGSSNCIAVINKNLGGSSGRVKASLAVANQAIGPANYSIVLPKGETVGQLKVGDIVKAHRMWHKIVAVNTTVKGNYAFTLYNCGRQYSACQNAPQ